MIMQLTVNEVAALTDVPPDAVRDEIERGAMRRYDGVVGTANGPRFDEVALVFFRCLHLLGVETTPAFRERVLAAVDRAVNTADMPEQIALSPVLDLHLGPIARDVLERQRRFEAWKEARVAVTADT